MSLKIFEDPLASLLGSCHLTNGRYRILHTRESIHENVLCGRSVLHVLVVYQPHLQRLQQTGCFPQVIKMRL